MNHYIPGDKTPYAKIYENDLGKYDIRLVIPEAGYAPIICTHVHLDVADEKSIALNRKIDEIVLEIKTEKAEAAL